MEQLSLLPNGERRCRYCHKVKPLTEFNFANRATGKRHWRCRACFSVYNRQRYAEKGERIRAAVRAYRWANREVLLVKATQRYWADVETSRAKGRATAAIQNARPERKAAKRDWARQDRKANPEKWREKSRREYRRNPAANLERQHRRRAQKLRSAHLKVNAALLAQRLAFYGGLCWMCRTAPAAEWDHVKPLARGGAHCLSNLRPACVTCNRRKSHRWPF